MQHVYEQAKKIAGIDEVVIATDDERVRKAVESFGGNVVMTSPDHPSGTDRVAEVAKNRTEDIVLNLQADEPELEPKDAAALVRAMTTTTDAEMGTLVHPELNDDEQADPSVVKAVVENGWATDFRREPTPGGQRHIGIYAYRADFLERFTALPPSDREQARKLEQMRALDNGTGILAVGATHKGVGIDTPADYAAFVTRWRTRTS